MNNVPRFAEWPSGSIVGADFAVSPDRQVTQIKIDLDEYQVHLCEEGEAMLVIEIKPNQKEGEE